MDGATVPTYPGESLNVEAAAMEPDAVNSFAPEKTTSTTLTLTIAPINCIEQEGTQESRCALDGSGHYLAMAQPSKLAQRLPQGLLERHLNGDREHND